MKKRNKNIITVTLSVVLLMAVTFLLPINFNTVIIKAEPAQDQDADFTVNDVTENIKNIRGTGKKGATITITKATGEVIGTSGKIRKNSWSIRLPKGMVLKDGDELNVTQTLDGNVSAPIKVIVTKAMNELYNPTMPEFTLYVENPSFLASIELVAIKNAIIDINPELKEKIYSVRSFDVATKKVLLVFNDFTTKEFTADKITVIKKEVSKNAVVNTLLPGAKSISGKLAEGSVINGTKLFIKFGKNNDKVDTYEITVQQDGSFLFDNFPNNQLIHVNDTITIFTEEPNKVKVYEEISIKVIMPEPLQVRDANNLTPEEKEKVKKAIEDANKDEHGNSLFPKEQGAQKPTKISVGDDGTVTITYPNGNVDVVPSEEAVVGLPRYDVIFDENGHGLAPDKQNIIENEKASKPEDLTADGFVFGGWYKEATCENSYDFNTPVIAAITLYAKWTKIPEAAPAVTQRIVPNTATK